MNDKIVIVAAKRSAIGSFGKSLARLSARNLGTQISCQTLSGFDPAEVNLVYVGNVLSSGLGQNIARQIALDVGLRCETPAISINQVCGSGLYSLILAAQAIQTGMAEVVLAGGVENMSNAPYLLKRKGPKIGHQELKDSMICDGLWDAFGDYHMGITAENVARECQISRQEQDLFALQSQKRAAAAQQNNYFGNEICAVKVPSSSGRDQIFEQDEYIRQDADLSQLNALKPAFSKDGTVTAGNASGINDGAAMLLLSSETYAKKKNWPILACLRAWNSCGLQAEIMGLGPAPSISQLLQQQGLETKDIQVYEINEAFAAQALAVTKRLQLDAENVNPWGGAIALGHPIGASGARIVCTLLSQLQRENFRYGVASLCVGGGMGTSVLLERYL